MIKPKVFVTGADGLLGSNLVRELLKQDFSVKALIYPKSTSQSLKGLKIERVRGDLLDTDGYLARVMRDCRFLFHCAAVADIWGDPDLTWGINFEGTRKILDASLKANIKRMVYVGSASSFQFGTYENPGDEQAPFPQAYKSVAPTFMFGSHDSRPSSGELIRQYINKNIPAVSPGGRNFVNVRNVAVAMVNALYQGETGQSYILGGRNLSYLDFFSYVFRVIGKKAPCIVIPKALFQVGGKCSSFYKKIFNKKAFIEKRLAQFSCINAYYSSAKAYQKLDMPKTNMEKTVAESIQSLRDYGFLNGNGRQS
jgi:dihydroflavonol-4-reductase